MVLVLLVLCLALWQLIAGLFVVLCLLRCLIVVLYGFCLAWWSYCLGRGSWWLILVMACIMSVTVCSRFFLVSFVSFVL